MRQIHHLTCELALVVDQEERGELLAATGR